MAYRRKAHFLMCARISELLWRFRRDEAGSYIFIATLAFPVLVGVVALGTEAGGWMFDHRAEQAAADSGAYSAAAAYVDSADKGTPIGLAEVQTQAWGVTATYGYTNAANNVDVTVNWPYAGDPYKVEVIVAQPQAPLFSILWNSTPTIIRARALAKGTPAVPGIDGKGCVLALNKTAAGAISNQGTTAVNLKNCDLYSNSNSSSNSLTVSGSSAITADHVFTVGGITGAASITTPDNTNDITTNANPTGDPYAGVASPVYSNGTWSLGPYTSSPGCDLSTYSPGKGTYTIGPSDPTHLFVICGASGIAMALNAGVTVNLLPGIYIIDQGSVNINGGATLNGTGVTLVFTSSTGSNWSQATINGNATLNLSAPLSGPTEGLVFYGDRNMPVGTVFKFNGGASQTIDGAIYVPKGQALFSGGSATTSACTQLVADTITFDGNANFQVGCPNGTNPIGSTPSTPALVTLIE
jgi:Flp pilus assembly protein TadG